MLGGLRDHGPEVAAPAAPGRIGAAAAAASVTAYPERGARFVSALALIGGTFGLVALLGWALMRGAGDLEPRWAVTDLRADRCGPTHCPIDATGAEEPGPSRVESPEPRAEIRISPLAQGGSRRHPPRER